MAELRPMPGSMFQDIVETIREQRGPATAGRRHAREVVALSSAFDPQQVLDLSATEQGRFLAEDCESVRRGSANRWRLRLAVRREVLAELDRDRRLQRLAPLSLPDPVGETAKRYVRGTAPPLTRQSLGELSATLAAVEWLTLTRVRLPAPEEVRGRLELEHMAQPLRTLVVDGFFGRERELHLLITHLQRTAGNPDAPSFSVLGPGGVGKSTLIARLLLPEIDRAEGPRRPFAYLSFDRHDLSVGEPLTLLREAALQLRAQRAELSADATTIADAALRTITQDRRRNSGRRAVRSSSASQLSKSQSDEDVLIMRFAKLLGRSGGDPTSGPIWVLDTFEVAQRQGAESLDLLWSFLGRLRSRCRGLQVVFTGRAAIDELPQEVMVLGDLDARAAEAFLSTQLADLELPPGLLAEVLAALPPYPLTLRLTSLLIRAIGADRLSNPAARKDLLSQLRGEQVQGVLYRRILDHIEDTDVVRLALPGLAVRRITRPVIAGFLAATCGIGAVDEDEADALFVALQREVALVYQDGHGGLVQRPEFRGLYLGLADEADPEGVERVRRAAVEYYSRPDSADKVEELYYRLALAEPTPVLDAAFDDAAARILEGSADELPRTSQAYLSARLGHSLEQPVLDVADDVTWGRQVSGAARRLLDAGRAGEAKTLLGERSSDVVIPFTASLLVEATAVVDGPEHGLRSAADYMVWAVTHHDDDLVIDLALIGARLAEDNHDYQQAMTWLGQAAGVAEETGDEAGLLAAQVAELRVHRRSGTLDTPEARRLRASLLERTDRLSRAVRAANPALIRDLAAELGDDLPWLATESLKLSGHSTSEVADAPLTSSEYGDVLRQHLVEDPEPDVRHAVVGDLQSESDEAAF